MNEIMVSLYKTSSSKNVINKSIDYTYSLEGTFRDVCDMINPIIQIDLDKLKNDDDTFYSIDILSYNYASLTITDKTILGVSKNKTKYYFIEHITYLTKSIVELRLHVDVLMTYKSDFINSTFFIERSSSSYNRYFEDDLQSFRSTYDISEIPLVTISNAVSYDTTFVFLNVNYQGTYTTGTGKNMFDDSIKNIDNYTYIIPNDSMLKEVLTYIKTNGNFASSIKSMYKLPLYDGYLFPNYTSTSAPFYPYYGIESNNTIFFNYPTSSINSLTGALFQSSLNDSTITLTKTQLEKIVGGPVFTLTLLSFTTPTLYTDYTDINHSVYKLLLPFIGEFEIDVREYNASDIYLYCLLDIRTGSTTLVLYNNTKNKILRVDNIDISMKIDTSTTNAQELKDKANIMGTQLLTDAMGSVTSSLTGALKGNADVSALTNGINLFGNVANKIAQGKAMHSASIQSGVNNEYGKYAFPNEPLLFKYKYQYTELNIAEFGRPSNSYNIISNLSGFVKIGGNLKNLVIYGTDEELEELKSLLTTGVYTS